MAPTGWPSAMAVGIDLFRIKAELAADGERLGGEGLVGLDHVEVGELQTCPVDQRADG